MRRAAALALGAALLLGGCGERPAVTASGDRAALAPAWRVAGDGPAAGEVSRQLAARGWLATGGGAVIAVAFTARPRGAGACAAADDSARDGCTDWLAAPSPSRMPFAPGVAYRLTLRITGADAAAYRIDATVNAKAGAAVLRVLAKAAVDRLAAERK